MSAMHTPGPWRIEPNEGRFCWSQINGDGWGSLAQVCTRLVGDDFDHPEGVANARLIAAAPELYEALENAVNALES